MTALEIRLIGYALAAIVILGGSAWVGAHFTAKHYEAVLAANQAAQQAALIQAQQRVIDAQNTQKAAETAAENAHALVVQADTASRTATLGSVRNLEAALHLVPAAVANPGAVQPTPAVPAGDPELTASVGRLNETIAAAISACQHDSEELAAILSLQPKVTP